MDENFSIGYWLRRQRLARDLRQDELAAQLGVATVTLRDKALLRILDNCEQVVDAASEIASVVAAAPQLRIIATSREALRVAARLYPVPPLAVPVAEDAGLGAPAAQLFLVRARAGRGEMGSAGKPARRWRRSAGD